MQTKFAAEHEIAISFASTETSRGLPKARILYAEDNPEIRELSADALRQAGYEVVAVADGGRAWEELDQHAFDLLITDNEMPFLTGLELIAKAQREHISLDVILTSGTLGHLRGPALGTVRLRARLQKPFTRGELLEAVEDALHGRHVKTAGD